MHFTTLIFAAFFTVVLTLSWWTRRDRTLQKAVLVAASFMFYGWFNWRLAILLAVSTLANYALSEAIWRAPGLRGKRVWLGASLVFNLGLLCVFKYFNFFSESLEAFSEVLGLSSHLVVLTVLLPAGISFYTFQAIAYCVDLYKGTGHRAKCLLDFAMFQSFFPKLLSGPLTRGRDLLPQIEAPALDGVPDFSRAASLILSGLLKKAVLAHYLDTHLISAAFDAPEHFAMPTLWVAMVGYSLLIYWDFSGYTDLARGLALLLGFELPENFNHPYVATSIGDYWRRWHMTFSQWLRDYIYIPLGGSRCPKWRAYLNLFITMLVCGIWHGAHWKFVMWGALHGFGLVADKYSRELQKRRGRQYSAAINKLRALGGWLWTFFLCSFSRVFFRAASFATAGLYISRLFDPRAVGAGCEWLVLVVLAGGLAMQFYGTHLRKLFIEYSERLPLFVRPVAWFGVGVALLALKPTGIAPYIYFGF